MGESDGLVVIDQHRAHERVLYERLSRAQAEGKIDRQRLVIPATLHLSPAESAALEDNLEPICQLGFEIETFGGRTFVMRAVPALLAKPAFAAPRCTCAVPRRVV